MSSGVLSSPETGSAEQEGHHLVLQALPDDVLLHIFTSLSAHALAAVKCTCTFFARHSPQGHDSLPITEAAARLKIAAVWGPERVSRSWLVALRLTELPLRRPGGGADVEVGLECENLVQHPRPAGKPPSEDAPCSVCGLRGNSWLNLTDGTVLCGRRQYDGSGGNSHALAHFRNSTGRPLAVKLGTIVAHMERGGCLEADVFSYPENNMVSDPLLAAHLAHFGVDAAAPLKPTARSVVGLGLDARAHFHHVLGRWIGAEEDAVGAIFASFHPLAQDLLIQEYRRQTRAYHALQRRCAGEGALGWRPPPRGDPEAAGGSEAEHLGLERDPVAAEQEAAFADMPLDELQEICDQEPSLPGFGLLMGDNAAAAGGNGAAGAGAGGGAGAALAGALLGNPFLAGGADWDDQEEDEEEDDDEEEDEASVGGGESEEDESVYS